MLTATFSHLLDIETVETGLVLYDQLDLSSWSITVDGLATTVVQSALTQVVSDSNGNPVEGRTSCGSICSLYYKAIHSANIKWPYTAGGLSLQASFSRKYSPVSMQSGLIIKGDLVAGTMDLIIQGDTVIIV